MNNSAPDAEQILFEFIDAMDEILDGELHILDHSEREDYPMDGEKRYRVYHGGGYCFDTYKNVENIDEETGKVTKWYYDFYSEYDGFNKIKDAETAFEIVKRSLIKSKNKKAKKLLLK